MKTKNKKTEKTKRTKKTKRDRVVFDPFMRRVSVILVGMTLVAGLVGGAGCAEKYECSMDVDCGWGTFCREGRCIAECQFDDDCDYPGMVCVRHRGYCRYPDAGVDDDSGTPNDAAVPDAATDGSIWQLDAATQQDGTVVTPDGSTPTDGIYTDPCTSGGGCASGFCFEDLRANTDFCSGTCVSDSSCILTHECASVSGQNLCQASDVGKTCSGTVDCNNNCIGNAQTGVGHCTAMCNSAADCPAGFACTSLSGSKYCVNISMTCTGPMDCLTGICLSDFGFYACTATCVSGNDCPLGYICDTDGYGNWYCVPPTAGTGGLGANCDGSTYTCQSGLCLGNYCTHECGVTHGVGQWCPPGYACNIAQGGTGNMMVCAAAGMKGFGQACANSNECSQGVCREMSDATMECSRFCNDGVPCPTGYTCQSIGVTASGVSLSVCDR